MKHRQQRQHVCVVSMVLVLVVSWGCNRASEPAPVAPTVDPLKTLRQMSDTLAGARQLTFTATRQLDAALVEGGIAPELATIEVSISRPRMVRARMVSDAGVRRFYADGQNVSLIDDEMRLYATVPLAGPIDDIVDALDDRYGFAPPLAEFVVNDPYQRFSAQIRSTLYRGQQTIGGVACDHLTLTGEIADADVWISSGDRLPRRFVATFKDREGSPRLTIDFSKWDLRARLDESLFVFDPPKDAERISMTTVEAAAAADGKGGTK